VERTKAGAIITILGAITATALFWNELSVLRQSKRVEAMGVDLTRNSTLRINLNITFPALPCQALSVDLADLASGVHDVSQRRQTVMPGDVKLAKGGRVHKWRLDRNGGHIGAHEFIRPRSNGMFFIESMMNGQMVERGGGEAEDPNAFSNALKAGEGCQIDGHLEAQRVAGNLHVSVTMDDLYNLPETQAQMRAALKEASEHSGINGLITIRPDTTRINVSHSINHLSFGDEFPGQVHPLDDVTRICTTGTGTHKYFLKVVPTEYRGRGKRIQTNQISVGEYYSPIPKGRGQMPAVFLIYDLSPITVTVEDVRQSLLHFLVRVCAVVGGVLTLCGLLDKAVHRVVSGAFELPGRNHIRRDVWNQY